MSFLINKSFRLIPGIALCLLVGILGYAAGGLQRALFEREWIEPLVAAILIGAIIRNAWTPRKTFEPGIQFSAKTLLEIAVALLGATISVAAVAAQGWALIVGVIILVPTALMLAYGIGRMLGVAPRVAMLAACGNAICGNSAIAAVAPVIGATGAEVASAIAFTALLGIVVVIALPLAVHHMSAVQYGTMAGLTVYAVPQVLAAAASGGAMAVHVGTIVKLLRVLMLGPVMVALSLKHHAGKVSVRKVVPWFIVAFGLLMAVHSLNLIPHGLSAQMGDISGILTVLAMAALGLQCDLKAVAQAGARVSVSVSLSMVLLALMAYGLIRLLGIA